MDTSSIYNAAQPYYTASSSNVYPAPQQSYPLVPLRYSPSQTYQPIPQQSYPLVPPRYSPSQTYQPYQPAPQTYQSYQPVPQTYQPAPQTYQPYQPTPQPAVKLNIRSERSYAPLISGNTVPEDMIQENTITTISNALDNSAFFNLLELLASKYHNDIPLVSDMKFDELVQIYESKFGPYAMVGAEPTGEMEDLPYYLSSLDKPKDGKEFDNWLIHHPGGYIVEDKIDGATLLILFKAGTVKIFTRGRGVRGQNVSHLAQYLHLPTIAGDLDVRGEVLLTTEAFSRVGGQHKSARNLVPGILKSKKSFDPVLAANLSFYAYRIMNSNDTVGNQMEQLTKLGFLTPSPVYAAALSWESLDSYYKQRQQSAPYGVDGLVVYQDCSIVYPVGKNPDNTVAFKPETPRYTTTIREIIWQSSKNRQLIPVAIYDDIDTGTAILNRASADNAKRLVADTLGPGARILIERRGLVIPRIMEVLTPAPQGPSYPDPNVYGKYDWDVNGTHFVLLEDNREVIASRLHHFLDTLGIKNVGEQRLLSFVDSGVKNITQLINLYPQDMVKFPGIGVGLAENLYKDIKEKLNGVDPAKIMDASAMFPQIGERLFELIFEEIPNFLQYVYSDRDTIVQLIFGIKGFADKRAELIADNLGSFVNWLSANPQITLAGQKQKLVRINTGAQVTGATDLTGMTFVFSGKRDKDLENLIKSYGGRIGDDVRRNTTALVLFNKNEALGKADKATKLGVPILSHVEFRQRYNIQ